jgi:hypothetical protein
MPKPATPATMCLMASRLEGFCSSFKGRLVIPLVLWSLFHGTSRQAGNQSAFRTLRFLRLLKLESRGRGAIALPASRCPKLFPSLWKESSVCEICLSSLHAMWRIATCGVTPTCQALAVWFLLKPLSCFCVTQSPAGQTSRRIKYSAAILTTFGAEGNRKHREPR